jgi:hypothetical protein
MCINLSFWGTLLVLQQQLTTLLAPIKPLLDLVEILEEIHYWWIRIVDLKIAICQTLLTFNNTTKLVELLEFKDSRVLDEYNYHRKAVLVEETMVVELGESLPWILNGWKKKMVDIPNPKYVLNVSLVDRKYPSNRFSFEGLVHIYVCICRCYKVDTKNSDFQKMFISRLCRVF